MIRGRGRAVGILDACSGCRKTRDFACLIFNWLGGDAVLSLVPLLN